MGVELLDHVADGKLGVDHAFRLALAPLADRLVDVGGEVAVAAEAVLIILDGRIGRAALPARESRILGVDAEKVVHRQCFGQRQQVGLEAAQRVLGLELERVVGELVSRD